MPVQEWRFPTEMRSYTLVILNQPITLRSTVFDELWNNASLRVCADGGANQLLSYSTNFIPDVIIGDLDSITSETEEWFREKGVKVVKDDDQDTTDLTKALQHASDNKEVLILGAFGGRLDHTFASIHCASLSTLNCTLLSETSLGLVLKPNVTHHIHPDYTKQTQGTIGIIPFYQPMKCSTTGLKWNLGREMHVGFGSGVVSTSNAFSGVDGVVVEGDGVMLFTTGVDWNGGK